MSGIACEYSDDSYAELKNFIEEFDAENEDAGAIMQKASTMANKCTLHAKPEDPVKHKTKTLIFSSSARRRIPVVYVCSQAPGSFGKGGRPRGPPAFVMEMLQPSEEEGVNRMIFGVVIPSEKPCNFSAIYGGGGMGPPPGADIGGMGPPPGVDIGGMGPPPGVDIGGDGVRDPEEGGEGEEEEIEMTQEEKKIQRLKDRTCEEVIMASN